MSRRPRVALHSGNALPAFYSADKTLYNYGLPDLIRLSIRLLPPAGSDRPL